MNHKDDSFQTLTLSLGVHFLLALWLLYFVEAPPSRNDSIEIQLIETQAQKERQQTFVPEAEVPDLKQKLKDQADYLSRLTKRVQEEMIARDKSGPTRNAQPQKLNPQAAGRRLKAERDLEAFLPRPEAGKIEREGSGSSPGQVFLGRSTADFFIPGVKEGAFTSLNSDQFLYFSFFTRTHEQIANRWSPRVRQYAQKITPGQQLQLAQSERITEVELRIDSSGRVHQSSVLRTSGFRELDEIAVQALLDVAPYLNPPLEMRAADGFIYLKYGFMLRFSPHQMVQR